MGGGGSHHETHYITVDRTEEIRRAAQRREEQRLAEERRKREIAEQQRIQRETEARIALERQRFIEEQEQIRRADERRRRIENERLERERRKLRDLQAKASMERRSLFQYKPGCLTGSDTARNHASEFHKLRIGVFGPTGSGKSCFINTCERAVRQTGKGSVPIATTGSEGTIILEDYLTEMFFRLVDTRGFFNYDHQEGKEMNDILYGRIKSGDFIKRSCDTQNYNLSAKKDVPFDEWLHAVIMVVKANDIRLTNGSLNGYLKPVRDILNAVGICPITVVTHKDTLSSPQACNTALQSASTATGSSSGNTFFIANYCPNNPGPDVNTELQVFEILKCALKASENYIENAKEKKNRKIKRKMNEVLNGARKQKPDSIVPHASIELFLKLIQANHNLPKDIDIASLTDELLQEDVTSLGILASCWLEINSLLPICLMKAIEADLQKMLMI